MAECGAAGAAGAGGAGAAAGIVSSIHHGEKTAKGGELEAEMRAQFSGFRDGFREKSVGTRRSLRGAVAEKQKHQT